MDPDTYEDFQNSTLTEQAEMLGFGDGAQPQFDVPGFIEAGNEGVILKASLANGNAAVILGQDRPHNQFSGFGGLKNTHCAAVDIVAGRFGHRARSHNKKGQAVNVNPNFKLDSARVYISQRSDPDNDFRLAAGTVGNTSPSEPRSTVALKADTLRFIARENIKLVTRTDRENSQGGMLTNASTRGYGIDLIALNDDTDMQPLVKGRNLQNCLKDTLEAIHDLRELFNNFLMYNRQFVIALMTHTHHSPFFGNLTAPDFTNVIPAGSTALTNIVTNVEAQLALHMQKLNAIQTNYLDATAGAEALEDGKSLFILSKYNNTN
jgi:hypothetical protein